MYSINLASKVNIMAYIQIICFIYNINIAFKFNIIGPFVSFLKNRSWLFL